MIEDKKIEHYHWLKKEVYAPHAQQYINTEFYGFDDQSTYDYNYNELLLTLVAHMHWRINYTTLALIILIMTTTAHKLEIDWNQSQL